MRFFTTGFFIKHLPQAPENTFQGYQEIFAAQCGQHLESWLVNVDHCFVVHSVNYISSLTHIIFTSFAGFWYPAKKTFVFHQCQWRFFRDIITPYPQLEQVRSIYRCLQYFYSIFYFIYCISSYTLYFVYFFTCHFFL